MLKLQRKNYHVLKFCDKNAPFPENLKIQKSYLECFICCVVDKGFMLLCVFGVSLLISKAS